MQATHNVLSAEQGQRRGRDMHDTITDAIALIDRAVKRIPNAVIVSELQIARGYIREVQDAARRWIADRDAHAFSEPSAVRQAINEIRFMHEIRALIPCTNSERQFYERTLAALLALLARRQIILQGAGRYGDMHREPSEEDRALWRGFEQARIYGGNGPAVRAGVAIEEAHKMGLQGGAWTAALLDQGF
jgi:hypothetical protein